MMHPSASTMRSVARSTDTRWPLVAAAVQADPALARRALLQSWYPVYAYLPRSGHPPLLAEAICIAFFEGLLRTPVLVTAAPIRGRFRDFLLAALRRFLALDWRETEEYAHDCALLSPADTADLEERHQHEPTGLRPDHAFHRGYALDLIAGAYRHLRLEAVRVGREDMFEALAPCRGTEVETGRLDGLAGRLDVRPLVLLLALQRLRQRFRELIEAKIAQTVGTEAEHAHERAVLTALLQ